MEKGYNGWKNYATWNIALWIGNDEGLYNLVKNMTIKYKSKAYKFFVSYNHLNKEKTKDGIFFLDSRLDYKALDEFVYTLNKNS